MKRKITAVVLGTLIACETAVLSMGGGVDYAALTSTSEADEITVTAVPAAAATSSAKAASTPASTVSATAASMPASTVSATATSTPTSTATATATSTSTATATATAATSSAEPTADASATTAAESAAATAASATPTATPTATATASATAEPTATAEATATATMNPDVTSVSGDGTPTLSALELLTNAAEGVVTASTDDLADSLASGDVTISESGEYTLTEYSGSNTITINEGLTVQLTITDSSITDTSTAPITVSAGAVLTLVLEGDNTLASGANYYAGIAVNADTKNDGTELIIKGDGTLTVTGKVHAPGIGSNKAPYGDSTGVSGKITIESGTIKATGGTNAPGIGGSYYNTTTVKDCSDITINGGIITSATTGNYSAGLGGAYYQPNGNIYINGGFITATGGFTGIGYGKYGNSSNSAADIIYTCGSVNASVNADMVDASQNLLSMITLTLPDGMENTAVMVDSATMYTDSSANLYVWVSSLTDSYAVEYDGKIYYTAISSGTTEYELSEYDGDSCSCDEYSASAKGPGIGTVTVKSTTGYTDVILTSSFVPSDACTYPLHTTTTAYSIAIDDVDAGDLADYAYISGNTLRIKYAAASKTIKLTTTITYSGHEYTAEEDIAVVGDDTKEFDISDGNIVIKSGSADGTLTVTVGETEYTVDADETIYIYQTSTKETMRTISVQADASVEISGLNIAASASISSDVINVVEGKTLKLTLTGTNVLTSSAEMAIGGVSASSCLEIDGDGSLTATSGVGAGIGKFSSITVNGGYIKAYGGTGGAGIGGTMDSAGKAVTINGGVVYAYGSLGAAGIGGGNQSAGAGGTFVMNAGMVHAESSENDSGDTGYGIGCGAAAYNAGSVTINAGSVNSTFKTQPSLSGTSQYLSIFTLEGVSGENDVTYTLDGGESIATSTDTEGKLYLYLTRGEHWLVVTKNATKYYKYIRVTNNSTDINECITNPTAKITSFEILGQTEETVINEDEKTITVTVPYNINLDEGVTPTVTYEGCKTNAGSGLTFTDDEATVTVTADDQSVVTYTVKITRAGEPAEATADTFDISKGDITIMSDGVVYGGVTYYANALGYIITGETDTYTFTIDSDSAIKVPIVFDNVSITSSDEYVSPLSFYNGANIKIEGECTVTSTASAAIYIEDEYEAGSVTVSFTQNSDGASLVVQGGDTEAVDLVEDNNTVKFTNLHTSIFGGTSQNAFSEEGSVVCDSVSYMRIVNNGAAADVNRPQDEDGNVLYQVAFVICEEDDVKACTYNDTEYTLDGDNTLYLMLPASDEQTFTVSSGKSSYQSKAAVTGDMTIDLYTTVVTSVVLDETEFTYSGGTVTITVSGTYVKGGNVEIKLVDTSLNEFYAVEDTDAETGDDAVFTAAIPTNPSYNREVTYTVYYIVGDDETKCDDEITVAANTSVARITAFTYAGQVGDTKITETDDNRIISITMPYDHEYQTYYTPESVEYIGSSISPSILSPVKVTEYSNYVGANYTVTANDKKTQQVYTVRIYRDTTPVIKSMSFQNPQTYEGGEVTVTLSGTALGNIRNAEDEDNRKVYVYSEDGAIAEALADYSTQSGTTVYSATITAPKNESDSAAAEYTLRVKIGDTVQDVTATLKVPRQSKSNTSISEFTVDNQVGDTEFKYEDGENIINITMPYDSDISEVYPNITLSDIYSTYSPQGSQNFESDVTYTVTAEDGETTEDYRVHLEKQETPTVTGIEFTSEVSSGAGLIKVTLNGSALESAANSVNSNEGIVVSGVITEGGTAAENPVTSGTASCDEDGNWTAYIVVPQNNDYQNAKKYTLSVTVNGTAQTLTGNTVLTVSRKLENEKELTSFILLSSQTSCEIYSDNTVYIKVPYNTDLSSLTPQVYHTGVSYTPEGAQDFNECPVAYTIYAEDKTYNTYNIYVERNGSAQVNTVSIDEQPDTFKGGKVAFDASGSFISSDEIVVYAVSRTGGGIVYGTVERDDSVYGGHMTLTLDIPENDSSEAVIYDLYVNVNGTLQTFGLDGTITVPRRTARTITSFEIDGQVSSTITETGDLTGEITVTMPYETKSVDSEPVYTYDGDAVTVDGTLDFYNSAKYTVSAADDTSRVYTVTLKRDGTPTIETVSVSDSPETYAGGDIEVEISGIFYDSVVVEAVDSDGSTAVSKTVDVTDGTAATSLTLPKNENTENSEEYTLRFTVDGYEDVEYILEQEISVPRRTTRTITSFTVDGQLSSSIKEIDDTSGEITVIMPYDVKAVTSSPTYTYDGDAVEASGALDFYNSTTYTVSAADDTSRVYTVTLARYGEPTIESVKVSDNPDTYAGGDIDVTISGIFYDSARVTATASDGSTVSGAMTINDGTAKATLTLPKNESTESAEEYTLSFTIDGAENVEYDFTNEIAVPRRTTREITAFSISAQEGDAVIDGTDITVTVPYNTDMTSVEPEIEFDADSITPTGAQDFSDEDNPVTYTLSSADDNDVTYTVYIVKNGVAPQITSFTVDKQKEETVYGDDSIYILISSGSLKEITPEVICTDGADYTPKGAQDFSKSKNVPVVYTVTNQYGVSKTYNVTIEKKSTGGDYMATSSSSSGIVITLEEESIDAVVGDEFTLEPTVTGTGVTPSYSTSNSKVAVVDSDGKVTIVGEGTAEITAYVYSAKTTVTINAAASDDSADDGNLTDNDGESNYIIPNYADAYISGYEDGTFRPNAYITRAETAAITARICVDGDLDYEADYEDVPNGAWYAGYVGYLTLKGIMNGYEDGTFRPDGDITRGELCAVVTRMMNCELSDSEPAFDDIKDSWASKYIMTLYDKGYVSGYEDGTFRPNGRVTRAETVAIMNNLVADGELVTNNIPSDVDSSFWAYDDIIKAMNDRAVSEDEDEE